MKKKVLATILSLSLPFLLMACTDSNKEENLSNKQSLYSYLNIRLKVSNRVNSREI